MSVRSNSINYNTVNQITGKYRFSRISLNNGTGNTLTLSATASELLEFKMPVSVYNLGRSYLSYTMPVPYCATKYNYFHDNTLEIADRMTYGPSGGMNLLELNYANNYINTVRPIDTPIKEFLSNDVTSGMCKPRNTAANVFPPTFETQQGNIYGLGVTGAYGIAPTELEPRYSNIGVTGVAAGSTGAGGLVQTRYFPLSGVKGTILAMDKDQYFPQNMYLRIYTALSGKVGFTSDQADKAINPTAFVTQPKLNNIYLYLAVEQDQLIIDSLIAKFNSGTLKYQIPYVASSRKAVAQGIANIGLELNNQYGKKLKRIITTNYNTYESLGTAYDHHNWNGYKVSSYQTYLGPKPLQDSRINCAQPDTSVTSTYAQIGEQFLDDWRENSKNCVDSVIQDSASYQLNWFHMDKFSEKNLHSDIPDENINEGLDLTNQNIDWSINMNVNPPSLVNYTFASFIRDIVVTPAGPVYV